MACAGRAGHKGKGAEDCTVFGAVMRDNDIPGSEIETDPNEVRESCGVGERGKAVSAKALRLECARRLTEEAGVAGPEYGRR